MWHCEEGEDKDHGEGDEDGGLGLKDEGEARPNAEQ